MYTVGLVESAQRYLATSNNETTHLCRFFSFPLSKTSNPTNPPHLHHTYTPTPHHSTYQKPQNKRTNKPTHIILSFVSKFVFIIQVGRVLATN
jgi:hypothetical protein